MRTEEAKVTLGVEEVKLIDKKLRTKIIKIEKPLIILEEKTIFSTGHKVKVVDADDFEKLGKIIKDFREDKKTLIQQLTIMEDILEDKKNYIHQLEIEKERLKETTSGGRLGRIKNIL
ncbi:hypothetical protein HYG87_09620 [Methanobacterium alkalithermotolerans]|uniref:Uncharacterized protein n=1 Tax=Methanobacterium alkalithermotolerans TaxID=2731220 RepID=A0A8T8K618_9EURY|nr:hypothetical protein [Methanobacterium alkalithermotolerans]QUH23994.1 hypothetical protein HYG87_09620 [Methanobacterium alkalithermotolerans]